MFLLYLRVGSVPFGVDGGEISALLDGQLEAGGVWTVEHSEFDFTADDDRAVATAILTVHRRHGLGSGLEKKKRKIIVKPG